MTTSVILVAAAMLAGCGVAPGASNAPVPEDDAGRRAWEILRACEARETQVEMRCHEEALLGILEESGVAAAMATAERMGDLDLEVRRDGHVYAHAIGLAAYTTPDEVGRIFASCTASYQSGCYHGVIQSYFVDLAQTAGEVGAGAMNALCADQRGPGGDRWLLFQCAHGAGHGVTLLYGHDLPRALEACDLIGDSWERQACYGGAFMENVVQATMPHHDVGRPDAAAHDHGGGHGHGGHAGAAGEGSVTAFKPLDPSDPLYPCSVLEERYLIACYQMQTSAMLHFNGGDLEAAAEACLGAPEMYRQTCFESLGRDVSARVLQDHARALEACDLEDARHRLACQRGYVKNVIDVTARAEDGFAFCRLVPDAEGKRLCNEAVGEQVWVLAGDEARRRALCAAAEPTYQAACLRGAGISEAGAGG